MTLRRASAFVVDGFDFGEADRIVVFFSAERGCKRGVARGIRRKYSRFQGRLELLNRCAVVWFEKEGAELVGISDAELERSADFLLRNLELMMLAHYLAEQVVTFVPEDEANPTVFRLLDKVLLELERGLSVALAARYFELWMLRLAGILPRFDECSICSRKWGRDTVSLVEDALLCGQCEESARAASATPRFSAESILAADALLRLAPAALMHESERWATPYNLEHWERLASEVRCRFLGRQLKSYEVMKRTLG